MKSLWLLITPALLSAQLPDGQSLYTQHCQACHGMDGQGTDHAPRLTGRRSLRARSRDELRRIINDGRPGAGMPAFDLPPRELDAVAGFVYSLNHAAAENAVPGSRDAGAAFFFGKGQCASCHMVQGQGAAIGPDLSNAGRELTVVQIREALLHPGKRVVPGYELVTVRLRNGEVIRGFTRGRSSFDLQLQDLTGSFHLLSAAQIASVEEEKHSIMPRFGGSVEALTDVIAYLSSLSGVEPGAPGPASNIVQPERTRPGEWVNYNGSRNGNRYSELTHINATNVSGLNVRWIFPINHFGVETTPLVADGVMYVTGPNEAFALDALTGRLIWKYARPRTQGLVGDASLGTNRGVAILGERLFMVTDNAHLIALNRVTGRLVWEVVMPDEPQHYGSTVAPLVVNDTVIAGVSGGDWGMRGFIACYRAATGERLWRHWTIPRDGEPGRETWKGHEPLLGGGSTWLTGSYDPETNTIYWPTGNPWPDSEDGSRGGDNLFTDCILALDASNGELKWHYQFTPHDTHDWDATEPPVLVDTRYQGRDRKLLLHADRNGFFYVFDRLDGKLLLARPFARRLNWASGIGPDGRPQLLPSSRVTCPATAANWGSVAFSPVTRLFYVLVAEDCDGAPVNSEPARKYVRAIDIDTGKIAWDIPQIGPVIEKTWPGILATAGGLVFYGDPNGAFAAAAEKDGTVLWHFATNALMKASPMTYTANGQQFVAVAAGPNILCFALPQ